MVFFVEKFDCLYLKCFGLQKENKTEVTGDGVQLRSILICCQDFKIGLRSIHLQKSFSDIITKLTKRQIKIDIKNWLFFNTGKFTVRKCDKNIDL